MEAETLKLLRPIFRSYKRSSSKLRDGAELLAKSGLLQLNVKWTKGENIQFSFNENPALVRYAALLRPFMAHNSPIELNSVWRMLSENGLVDVRACERFDQLLSSSENLGIAVVLNERKITARDLYFAYAEGQFFDEDPEAKKLLEQLSVDPMHQMVAFLFHSACVSYSSLVFFVLDVILGIGQGNFQLGGSHTSEPRCVYCLTQDGDFGPEEHIIPEAFGNDELIIHGAVCQTCNNDLSKLDQFLTEFEPLALLRVLYVDLTKKGKFPRADLREFVVEKMKPRELRFISRSGRDVFEKEKLPDGSIHLTIKATGRRPLDIPRLGRSLFKIGLGLVAHDQGPEYACDGRFDAARNFIRGSGVMPNYLLISKNAIPCPMIKTFWQSFDGATVVILNFFGICFAFNLETTPFKIPDEMPTDIFDAFWLGA